MSQTPTAWVTLQRCCSVTQAGGGLQLLGSTAVTSREWDRNLHRLAQVRLQRLQGAAKYIFLHRH